jgi:hypothetical protein
MPVDLGKATTGVRGAQALGLLEKGGHRVVVIHSFFLKFYFGFLSSAGRAELFEF